MYVKNIKMSVAMLLLLTLASANAVADLVEADTPPQETSTIQTIMEMIIPGGVRQSPP